MLVIFSSFLFEDCCKLVTFGWLCLDGFFLSFLCVVVASSAVLCSCSSCDAGGLSLPHSRFGSAVSLFERGYSGVLGGAGRIASALLISSL